MYDEWETPQWLIDKIEEEYGKIDLDAAANERNAKAPSFFSISDGYKLDGLVEPWFGIVFCNPPYSRNNIKKWVKKAFLEIKYNKKVDKIIMLLPVRTSTEWFQDYVLPFAELEFIRGRIHFCKNGEPSINTDFYDNMLAIYDRRLCKICGKQISLGNQICYNCEEREGKKNDKA